MLPFVWAQTKATGRGRPNGAAAIEAYNASVIRYSVSEAYFNTLHFFS